MDGKLSKTNKKHLNSRNYQDALNVVISIVLVPYHRYQYV